MEAKPDRDVAHMTHQRECVFITERPGGFVLVLVKRVKRAFNFFEFFHQNVWDQELD